MFDYFFIHVMFDYKHDVHIAYIGFCNGDCMERLMQRNYLPNKEIPKILQQQV